MSRDQLGARWPLTVDGGVLHCEIEGRNNVQVVTFKYEGTTYAVSGPALELGHKPINLLLNDSALNRDGSPEAPLYDLITGCREKQSHQRKG